MSDSNATQTRLEIISDRTKDAHARIQQDFQSINPVVGLNRRMRNVGFPVDTITIDCLQTRRRIIILLNDETPETVQYQFAFKDKDPSSEFKTIQFNALTEQMLYDWMVSYFSSDKN